MEYQVEHIACFMVCYGQMFAYDMLTSYDPKGIRNFPTYFNYWTEEVLRRKWFPLRFQSPYVWPDFRKS